MNLELKLQLMKFFSFLLNTLFLALGLSVAGCGVWILFDKGNFLSILTSAELSTIGFGLLLIGCVVIAVAVIGCIGVYRDDKFLLLIYLSLFVVLVLGQLFVTLLLLINRKQIEESVDGALDLLILEFGNRSSSEDLLINNLQIHAECCGRTGRSDWLNNTFIISWPQVLPCSCFSTFESSGDSPWCLEHLNASRHLNAAETLLLGTGSSPYEQGCKQALSDWLHENIVTIVAMVTSLLIVQLLQFAVVFSLYHEIGKNVSLKQPSQLMHPGDFDDDQQHISGDSGSAHTDHQMINDHNR